MTVKQSSHGRVESKTQTGAAVWQRSCIASAVLLSLRVMLVAVLALLALCASACSGAQSTLNAAGSDAQEIAVLFWWMTGGAVAVWILMLGLGFYCTVARRPASGRLGIGVIAGGGVVLPVVVLVPLMAFSLPSLPRRIDSSATTTMTIAVAGEQWFWRVRYLTPEHGAVDLANELRLPVGQRVDIRLSSDNVIHSFWIPSLSGKVDMIPGRETFLSLEPTRIGRFRGVCAEYCGTSHALMAFVVDVVDPGEFNRWLDGEAAAARAPASAAEIRGFERFAANGCGACHTIRGTSARGLAGPDLTHVGGRLSLAAGVRPNDPSEMHAWIAHAEGVKPGARMPSFTMLAPQELADVAVYLSSLQ
jgi:cytochrome c oxidase subunit II